MEDVDELRKTVAQAYCLHKHIVNEFHYEQHVCGARVVSSREKKREGLIVLSTPLPPGTLRRVCPCL